MTEITTESDLLRLTDYDSAEFIDRIRGSFQQCCRRAESASTLQRQTTRRIDGMKRHTFDGLAEIGEAFLRVQEARPGEFEAWFAIHEERLEMCLRTAETCKAQARNVRQFGADQAFSLSLDRKPAADAVLAASFRLTRDPSEMNAKELSSFIQRAAPVVTMYMRAQTRLESIGVASLS